MPAIHRVGTTSSRLTAALGLLLLSACGGKSHFTPVSYTVGGSISGLTSSGLVLLDNGSDALNVAADAKTFTFGTPLLSGSTYAVTVQTQPLNETCTVNDGSGTAQSDITSISIICSPHSFSIGGSIAGLTASGLVLLDNGTDALSVAAEATRFEFPTPLASGSRYAVTVKTQPQGQTCTVSNGTGTVSANVTDVAIACSLDTYTIGGSISGLTSAGLVLLDNGGDALTLPASASSFTFATALVGGSSYAVSVESSPPGETCSVANGSGTANANVTNVGVSCQQLHYTLGGSVSGLTALSGLVLLDNGGDALTVPANATTFTFPTELVAGASYHVTVQSPGPTGETCTVDNDSGTATGNVTNVSVACLSDFASGGPNVVSIRVTAGPAAPASQTFNIPLVTVRVCDSTGHCADIPDVLVDTGSAGLRLLASVVTQAGLTLTPTAAPQSILDDAPATDGSDQPDDSGKHGPADPATNIYECMPFPTGDAWGAVSSATISIGGESTGKTVAVQVMDDSGTPPPSFCAAGANLSSVNTLNANGVLGVGIFAQDCGSACDSAINSVYYSCSASGSCAPTAMPTGQVSNPVASFPKDDNGVIVQLPAIAAAGAPSASGYLVFGIGTEHNNGLDQATLLKVQASGDFTTVYGGQMLTHSLIDSGVNRLYFPNGSPLIPTCPAPPAGPGSGFYCPGDNPPSSPLALSATNQGSDGTSSAVSFNVVDLTAIASGIFATPDAAGPASGGFDWGLPFFFGRTVYVALSGTQPGGTNGAYGY